MNGKIKNDDFAQFFDEKFGIAAEKEPIKIPI